jgi:tetratricopeptide (TPR) repeat protein
LKWILVVALVVAGGWLFHVHVDSEQEPYKALGFAAGGLACIVVAAGFVIVPLGQMALGVIDLLFMPTGTYTPPALYKLPEWYVSQCRYSDALEEYEKILKHHPRDPGAYEGMLYVLYCCMGNVPAAEKLFPKALRRTPKDRQPELQAYMEALRNGVAAVPQRAPEEAT